MIFGVKETDRVFGGVCGEALFHTLYEFEVHRGDILSPDDTLNGLFQLWRLWKRKQ